MNSGLYAFAGASATATAAAWANRLLDPMTNVSNVYFGLSRAGSARPDGRCAATTAGAQLSAGAVSSVTDSIGSRAPSRTTDTGGSTVTATRTSRPSWIDSAVVISGRSRVSSSSLANSLGTATSAVSSTRPS